MKNIIPLVFVMFMNSCSSLSKEDCINTSWLTRGKRDSTSFNSKKMFSKHKEQCSEHGVDASESEYMKGYEIGLKKICNHESGYQYGLSGQRGFNECEKFGPSFEKGHKQGLVQFKINEREEFIRQNNKCTFNHQCDKNGSCITNRCQHNGMSCNFDSDCKISGNCFTTFMTVPSTGELVSINKCQ